MPGKPKLTKFVLARALERSSNITGIARELGVSRHTVYRSVRRWGLDTATLLKAPAACADTSGAESKPQPQIPQTQSVESKDQAAKPEPNRNTLRLPISDFTGVNLSERPRRRYY